MTKEDRELITGSVIAGVAFLILGQLCMTLIPEPILWKATRPIVGFFQVLVGSIVEAAPISLPIVSALIVVLFTLVSRRIRITWKSSRPPSE